ncbi:hypothetical protein FH972_026461 [Carpinus fangiana]|uniref:Uncharacterized protein n=1 Tax=Carpinus fangiana TaxID=176857 RepID=A0A5N6L4E3_9ROSI|nr:hypothetical protein FH972_026461 [Carpinus fangiana]
MAEPPHSEPRKPHTDACQAVVSLMTRTRPRVFLSFTDSQHHIPHQERIKCTAIPAYAFLAFGPSCLHPRVSFTAELFRHAARKSAGVTPYSIIIPSRLGRLTFIDVLRCCNIYHHSCVDPIFSLSVAFWKKKQKVTTVSVREDQPVCLQ